MVDVQAYSQAHAANSRKPEKPAENLLGSRGKTSLHIVNVIWELKTPNKNQC